jgi:hypothetical protein
MFAGGLFVFLIRAVVAQTRVASLTCSSQAWGVGSTETAIDQGAGLRRAACTRKG